MGQWVLNCAYISATIIFFFPSKTPFLRFIIIPLVQLDVATAKLGPWDPARYVPSVGAAVLVAHSILVDGILNVTLPVFSQCFLGMVMVSRLQPLQSVVMVMVHPRSYMVQKWELSWKTSEKREARAEVVQCGAIFSIEAIVAVKDARGGFDLVAGRWCIRRHAWHGGVFVLPLINLCKSHRKRVLNTR